MSPPEEVNNNSSNHSLMLSDNAGRSDTVRHVRSPEAGAWDGPTGLPDLNEGEFSTDDFRMYKFKIKPCYITYRHEWNHCPYFHPAENAKRRSPRAHKYSPLQCKEFRVAKYCHKGDSCEFAHGLFETWLHPAQYRIKLCRDGPLCARKVCFFAHNQHELRPIYKKSGCAERNSPSQLFSEDNESIVFQDRPSTLRSSNIGTGQRNFDTSDIGMLCGTQRRIQDTRLPDELNSPPLGMFQSNLGRDYASHFNNTSTMPINDQDSASYQTSRSQSLFAYLDPNWRTDSRMLANANRFLPNAATNPSSDSFSFNYSDSFPPYDTLQ